MTTKKEIYKLFKELKINLENNYNIMIKLFNGESEIEFDSNIKIGAVYGKFKYGEYKYNEIYNKPIYTNWNSENCKCVTFCYNEDNNESDVALTVVFNKIDYFNDFELKIQQYNGITIIKIGEKEMNTIFHIDSIDGFQSLKNLFTVSISLLI